MDQTIAQADAANASRAEYVTDQLGLVFPSFNKTAPAMNQRYVLHIPFAVVARKPVFRPTVIEAGGYTRFKARVIGAATPGWGKTLDLAKLAASVALHDGLDEITTWPLTLSDFQSSEYLELEYLGAIGRPRGQASGVDCDQTVASLLMGNRTTASAMRSLR
jgi:hypothetical protein